MAFWEHNEKTIGYSINGEGTAILAFHGTTQKSDAWNQVREACTTPMQWIGFEFPGSGESSMPSSPLDLDEIVHDAVALMTHLGHTSFHVVGYSLGAVAALRCAAMYPSQTRTVTSLCGWSVSDARMKVTFDLWRRLIAVDSELFMRYALADGYTAAGLEALAPMYDMVVTMAASGVQAGSDAHLELDIRVDIESSLQQIQVPCLVIGAIEDRWVDIAKARHIASQVNDATLVELPAGHLVIGELAPEIATALSKHVSK
jgi:3-oxoadipate enol-lactonase